MLRRWLEAWRKKFSEQNFSEVMFEYLQLFIAVMGVSGTVIFIFIMIVFLTD